MKAYPLSTEPAAVQVQPQEYSLALGNFPRSLVLIM